MNYYTYRYNMKKITDKIKALIDEKADEINRNRYFILTINVQDGNPLQMKIEHSLKPVYLENHDN